MDITYPLKYMAIINKNPLKSDGIVDNFRRNDRYVGQINGETHRNNLQ